MGIDLVSSGELYTALQEDFDVSRAFLHGNNKTDFDINYAMEQAMKKNFIRDNCKELYYVTDKLDDLLRYVETPVNKIRTVKELKDG